jgi:hypothetical protein
MPRLRFRNDRVDQASRASTKVQRGFSTDQRRRPAIGLTARQGFASTAPSPRAGQGFASPLDLRSQARLCAPATGQCIWTFGQGCAEPRSGPAFPARDERLANSEQPGPAKPGAARLLFEPAGQGDPYRPRAPPRSSFSILRISRISCSSSPFAFVSSNSVSARRTTSLVLTLSLRAIARAFSTRLGGIRNCWRTVGSVVRFLLPTEVVRFTGDLVTEGLGPAKPSEQCNSVRGAGKRTTRAARPPGPSSRRAHRP